MKLVIVESPAKAKTINKYLGKDFQVLASFGHIRDVPSKNDSIRPEEGFAMDWEVQARGEKTVREIVKALSSADALYLASDPDREGEAIAWHVVQELKRRKKLKDSLPVHRVVFHEITKKAVTEAIQNPREINMQLVEAYLARRALDYLVGFQISPLLWKKLPGAKSAGRVQSVALRLVCDREDEILSFVKQEYWGINVDLETTENDSFSAKLTQVDGQKLEKFDIPNQETALQLTARIQNTSFTVGDIEKKQLKRNPAPPFTTSTLQQEASRKLNFSSKRTMQVAQQLYEGGLITYMRTDAVALAEEAIAKIRTLIEQDYGNKFLPKTARVYKNSSKNAQEAHEAIRPTDITKKPETLSTLTAEQSKLYGLIWKRTLACQMENAIFDKVGINIYSEDKNLILRATGQTIAFAGFIKVYKEDIDDGKEEDSTLLPPMQPNDALKTINVTQEQHWTEPPPRFSEASLVKRMEELGIGRPSTYATILSVLQEREYVRLENKRFIPNDRGYIVTAFLENYFPKYVEYDYTAGLENKLDDITNGALQWKGVLTDFWEPFNATVQSVAPIKMADVLQAISKRIENTVFPNPEAKKCPNCENGILSIKFGKFGSFIGCSNYPKCGYSKPITLLENQENPSEETETTTENTDKLLGKDSENNNIYLKKGPYGWYVQAGEGKEAKRTGIPKGTDPTSVLLEQAVQLLSLPRTLGTDPKTKQPVKAAIGRYGPYVCVGKNFVSLPATENVLTVQLETALQLLAGHLKKETVVGKWNDMEITYQVGRYGPYVKCGKIMASCAKDGTVPTEEQAISLLQKRMNNE